MSVLAVKINLCNTLFPYRGDYRDKDNERILLANVIGECIKSLQLDKNINQKELRCCRECRSARCEGLKGGRCRQSPTRF